MKRYTSQAKLTAISRQAYPDSLLGVSATHFQRALVDESVIIRTQMGSHNVSEMVAVYGIPYAIPCSNSNSNSKGNDKSRSQLLRWAHQMANKIYLKVADFDDRILYSS
jgi:hypothetical protein